MPIDTSGWYLSLYFVLSCQCARAFFQLKQNILLELTIIDIKIDLNCCSTIFPAQNYYFFLNLTNFPNFSPPNICTSTNFVVPLQPIKMI